MTTRPGLSDTPLYGIEIHDRSLWEPARVLPVIGAMKDMGYNALVLHQNDLLDVTTQLGLTANYGVTDLRLKKVRNNVAWLNDLTRRLAEFDARLFLEIKEPSFEVYALEFFPGLLGPDGHADPIAPDWPVFCRAKIDDLLARVPDLGGIILNLSSPESRVSLPDHLASTGAHLDRGPWFDAMIAAFQTPLRAAAKDLYVRDFSYTPDMQSYVLAAVERQAGRVGASVKITAHDYFPQYPQNPAAAGVSAPLIFEFEAFGEHTGWGVIPNCRVAELQDRMNGYRALGANGFLVRISWEAISGVHALDGLSAVNVHALRQLADKDQNPRDLVTDWLAIRFGLTGDVATRISDIMLQSWNIPAASYWNGQVFPRHSCVASSWQEAWLSMQTHGMGRRDRDLAIDADDPRLSENARRDLFNAKADATALATKLAKQAFDISAEIPVELVEMMATFAWLPNFSRQFELATRATFYAARFVAGHDPDDLRHVQEQRVLLVALADDIQAELAAKPKLPHHHRLLFDPAQLRTFCRSLPTE